MTPVPRLSLLVAALALGLLTAGCAASPSTRGSDASAPSPHSADAATQGAVRLAGAVPTRVTKLLVVIEENHSLGQMQQGMPYTFDLARQYGYATNYRAVAHPSLPNYIAIAGGKTYGISDDAGPSAHRLKGRSVFGQALKRNRTAALYAQKMPRRCATRSHGAYAVKHNPWAYFVRERAQCRKHDFGMSRFGRDVRAGNLPRVGMVIPDLNHDAHDGSLQQADDWFRSLMTKVFAGDDWKSGRLAVVLTADEDDRAHGNRVLTVVIHPSQDQNVVNQRLTHYSLTRLYDEVARLPFLHKAKGATSMATAFGLPVR